MKQAIRIAKGVIVLQLIVVGVLVSNIGVEKSIKIINTPLSELQRGE